MIITLIAEFLMHNRYTLLEISDESFNSSSRDNLLQTENTPIQDAINNNACKKEQNKVLITGEDSNVNRRRQ